MINPLNADLVGKPFSCVSCQVPHTVWCAIRAEESDCTGALDDFFTGVGIVGAEGLAPRLGSLFDAANDQQTLLNRRKSGAYEIRIGVGFMPGRSHYRLVGHHETLVDSSCKERP